MDTLKVEHATALPTREISALTTRTGPEGQLQLLAVGDEDFAVIKAEFDDNGRPAETFRYDLFLPLVETSIDLRGGSGFEGVACDPEEVYVLQEEDGRYTKVNRRLTSSPGCRRGVNARRRARARSSRPSVSRRRRRRSSWWTQPAGRRW
jgi:hypothetical protein